MHIDVRQFVQCETGGVRGLIDLFEAYGQEPPHKGAVQKWLQRGSIPSDWLLKILCLVEIENQSAVSVLPYVER